MATNDVGVLLNAALTERILEACKTPLLQIHLDRNMLLGTQPLIRLFGPGPTPRSKPVDLLGLVIVGETTHSEMLRHLAGVLEQVGR